MFGATKKADFAKGLLLQPNGIIEEVNLIVDSPIIETAKKKGSEPKAWVLNGPLRFLESVGSYIMLRPDRLTPLAPSSSHEELNPLLLSQAINKRYTAVTSTPINKSLGSILIFDIILLGLACLFGLITVIMMAPRIMEFIKGSGIDSI